MKRFSLTLPFLILLISCDKSQREVVVEKWDDGTPSKVNFVVGEGLKQEIVGRMTYYENGEIQTKEEYRENKNNGLYIRYYENGKKSEEGTYKDGEKDGKWTKWDDYGVKDVEETYKDGKLNGLSTWWYENGEKKQEGTYKDGSREGKWTNWYENGEKKQEGTYKDGKKSKLKCWNERGKKIRCK